MKHRAITLLGGLAILAVTLLASQLPLRSDSSSFSSNSLPINVAELLKSIPNEIHITAHIREKPELKQRIKTALEPYIRVREDIHIQWQPLLNEGSSLATQGQLLLSANGHSSRVHTLSQTALNAGFYHLASGKTRWIGLIQSGSVFNIQDPADTGYQHLSQHLTRQGFEVFALDPATPVAPDNLDALWIRATDQAFSSPQLDLIKQWLHEQRPALWFQEGAADTETRLLLAQYGIQILPGLMVDADAELRESLGLRHPAVIAARVKVEHPWAQSLKNSLVFPISHGFRFLPQTEVTHTSLINSGEASWNETSPLSGKLNLDTEGESKGPHTVVLLTEHNTTHQRLIVMGDSDFLNNRYFGLGGNEQLATHAARWLTGDDALIALDTRHIPDSELSFPPHVLTGLAIFWLLAVPCSLLLTGLWLWYRRRHARIT